MKNSNIKTLQFGKTWSGLVRYKNLPDRLSCEKYELSGRLSICIVAIYIIMFAADELCCLSVKIGWFEV